MKRSYSLFISPSGLVHRINRGKRRFLCGRVGDGWIRPYDQSQNVTCKQCLKSQSILRGL